MWRWAKDRCAQRFQRASVTVIPLPGEDPRSGRHLVFSEATARVLRAAGFEVSLATDHRLALEDLESTRPIDLLITDIVMPDRVNGVRCHVWRRCVGRDLRSSTSPATISKEWRTRRTALSCASQSTRGTRCQSEANANPRLTLGWNNKGSIPESWGDWETDGPLAKVSARRYPPSSLGMKKTSEPGRSGWK